MTSEVETIRRDATALEAAHTMLCRGVNRRGFGCVFAALLPSVQILFFASFRERARRIVVAPPR